MSNAGVKALLALVCSIVLFRRGVRPVVASLITLVNLGFALSYGRNFLRGRPAA